MVRNWHQIVVVIVAVAMLIGLSAAAQPPAPVPPAPAQPATGDLSRKDLDKRLHKLVADTINLGADTYNGGNPDGCYFLYLGTLRSLTVVLDHRPTLQKTIDDKIKEAKAQRTSVERAFTLRKALDECYAILSKDVAPPAVAKLTLWDRLGGEKAVRAVVHDMVASAAIDPKVNITRGGKYPITEQGVKDLEQKLVELVSATSGGPFKYTGKDMKAVHKGMGITNDEFDALGGHLAATLIKYKVPAQEQKEMLDIINLTRGDIVEAKKLDENPPIKKIEDKKIEDKKVEDKKIDQKKVEANKSLYERLGGDKVIEAVVDDFVTRAAGDPKVNFLRKGTPAEVKVDALGIAKLKKALVNQICQAAGGPQKYTGPDMATVHKGMGITGAEFDALAGDLKASLDHFKVPAVEQQELLAIVGSTRAAIVEEKK